LTASPHRKIWLSLYALLALLLALVVLMLTLVSEQERQFSSLREHELEFHLATIATIGRLHREFHLMEQLASGRSVHGVGGGTRFGPASILHVIDEGLARLQELQAERGDPDFEHTVRRAAAQYALLVDAADPGGYARGEESSPIRDEIASLELTLNQLARLHNHAYSAAQHRYQQESDSASVALLVIVAGTSLPSLLLIGFFMRPIRSALGRLKNAEAGLRQLNTDLEQRVEERAAALRAAQEQLIRAERLAALGQLTATVGHELRNPLGTIHASFRVVRNLIDDPPPKLQRAIQRIELSIERCLGVIGQLLSYSQVRELHLAQVALDPWVRTVLEEQQVPEGMSMAVELRSGTMVRVDGDRLRQAVVNVVDNAWQAMGESVQEGARHCLYLSTRLVDGHAEIQFADNGPGIPPEIRDQIFEPLVSGRSFGVGLGLPLVKDVLELHHGSVEACDGVHGGTVVTLRLPSDAVAQAESR
jgi:signal transduction histidine kinase